MIWEIFTKMKDGEITKVIGFRLVSESDRDLNINETKERPILDYEEHPLGYVLIADKILPYIPDTTPEEIAQKVKLMNEAAMFTPEAFAKLVKRVEVLEGRD